jgi:hypothetical protein
MPAGMGEISLDPGIFLQSAQDSACESPAAATHITQ